jgi:hypothetical protein
MEISEMAVTRDPKFRPQKVPAKRLRALGGSSFPVPSVSTLQSDAAARKLALKRRQIERISPPGKANPNSKNTDDVFTSDDNTRYARTDLYRPIVRDRVNALKTRASVRSHARWGRNKKTVAIAAAATVAGWMIYSVWKNAQLRKKLAHRKVSSGSHHAGIFSQFGYSPFAPQGYELDWTPPCAYGCPDLPQSFYDWPSADLMGYPSEYASWW